MQFHGDSDLYAMDENTRQVAALYTDAKTRSDHPAVTLREVPGGSGRVAAFAYDRPVPSVLSCQGNPRLGGPRKATTPHPLQRTLRGRQGQGLRGHDEGRHSAGRRTTATARQHPDGGHRHPEPADPIAAPSMGAKAVCWCSLPMTIQQICSRGARLPGEAQKSAVLLGGRLGVHPIHVAGVHQREFDRRRTRLPREGLRLRRSCEHRLQKDWTKQSLTKTYTDDLASP